MLSSNLAAGSGAVSVSGSNLTWVVVVGVVALLALAVAALLVREVLAASQGTERMQEIAKAVQEGAAAYLRRQFRTLGVFVVIIFFVLLLLPADGSGVRWGRSIFFLVGALFSGLTGFTGMSLAVRGNVRVAAAARAGFDGERPAMRIAFRTGGVAGMFTGGAGAVRGRARGVHLQGQRARTCWRASASARRCWPCSCGSAAASSPRPPTWAPTWSARSRRASPRTTRGTPRPSRTTSATTWATAPGWPPTCSSPTRSCWSPR